MVLQSNGLLSKLKCKLNSSYMLFLIVVINLIFGCIYIKLVNVVVNSLS